jgi:hypothetical protein
MQTCDYSSVRSVDDPIFNCGLPLGHSGPLHMEYEQDSQIFHVWPISFKMAAVFSHIAENPTDIDERMFRQGEKM